jgi:membrane-associated phospholipid phosphatase
MSAIFISYCRNDRSAAEALSRAFEGAGQSVWWDREIPAGGTFDKMIEDALSAAEVVIVLWSHESVQSRWVRNEAEEAAARNILVPVLIESDVRIPLAFKRIQAADLVGWEGDAASPAFQSLLEDVGRRIVPRPEALPSLPRLEPESSEPSFPRTAEEPRRGRLWFFRTRAGLTSLLAVIFCANYVETLVETMLRRRYGVGVEAGERIAFAFRALEGNLTFASHDVVSWTAVYGYSAAYFFLLPIVGLAMIIALLRRQDLRGYRILVLAVAVNYLLSIPFFVLFPVPERWTHPDSGAILLSDRWSFRFIELLRPISGVDNCFPSSHTSITVVIVLVAYLCGVRFRHTTLALGAAIIVSTFVLGIHWIPDVLAGIAVGFLSVAAARYLSPLGAYPVVSRVRVRASGIGSTSTALASLPATSPLGTG